MADSPLAKRLGIKPGNRVLVLDAPETFWGALGDPPQDTDLKTSPDGTFDVVLRFVRDKQEIDQHALAAIDAAKPGAWVWFGYPKKTSKIKTDISRDAGWDVVHGAGWEGIAIISIDDTWSAVRFRPVGDIKRR